MPKNAVKRINDAYNVLSMTLVVLKTLEFLFFFYFYFYLNFNMNVLLPSDDVIKISMRIKIIDRRKILFTDKFFVLIVHI